MRSAGGDDQSDHTEEHPDDDLVAKAEKEFFDIISTEKRKAEQKKIEIEKEAEAESEEEEKGDKGKVQAFSFSEHERMYLSIALELTHVDQHVSCSEYLNVLLDTEKSCFDARLSSREFHFDCEHTQSSLAEYLKDWAAVRVQGSLN